MLKLLHEGHTHEAGSEHSHEHGHHHHHHDELASKDQAYALLSYTYDHNDHHAGELDDLVKTLRENGKDAVADKVEAAQVKFREGNALLHDALHAYTE